MLIRVAYLVALFGLGACSAFNGEQPIEPKAVKAAVLPDKSTVQAVVWKDDDFLVASRIEAIFHCPPEVILEKALAEGKGCVALGATSQNLPGWVQIPTAAVQGAAGAITTLALVPKVGSASGSAPVLFAPQTLVKQTVVRGNTEIRRGRRINRGKKESVMTKSVPAIALAIALAIAAPALAGGNTSVTVSSGVQIGGAASQVFKGPLWNAQAGGYGYNVNTSANLSKYRGPGFRSTFVSGSATADYGSVGTTAATPFGSSQSGAYGSGVTAGSYGSQFQTPWGRSRDVGAYSFAQNGGAFSGVSGPGVVGVSVAAGQNASTASYLYR
jgi:hypothetical protein